MRIAISSPNASAYSETFIHMQMERLPCALRIYGGPVASETVPGGSISPLRTLTGIVETAWDVIVRRRRWEGPQARELVRRLRKEKIDTLLANYGPCAVALAEPCRRARIPLVAHFHGFDAHRDDILRQYGAAYRELGAAAHAIIVVSEAMKARLLQIGVAEQKIHLIRYGVDLKRFEESRPGSSNPTFLAVGRFVDKKAPLLTMAAFAKVHRKHPECRLTMIGDGPLLEAAAGLAQGLGVSDAITFVGAAPPEAVAKYMRAATAFVQHSLVPKLGAFSGDSEGTPVAILEAMAAGLPVISTRHAGIVDVVEDGRTGYLVDERDVDGMADRMACIIDDPVSAQAMGALGRQLASEHYSAERYIDNILKLLAEIGAH